MDKREGLVGVEDIAVGYGVRRVEEQRGAAEKDERDDYDRNESKRHKQIPPSRTSTLFPFFIFNQKTQTAEELEQATSQYKKNLIDLKKRYKKDTLQLRKSHKDMSEKYHKIKEQYGQTQKEANQVKENLTEKITQLNMQISQQTKQIEQLQEEHKKEIKMDMTMNGAHKEQVQSLQEEIEELKMRYAEQITKNTKQSQKALKEMQEAYSKEKLLQNEKLKKSHLQIQNLENQFESIKDRNNKLILSQSMGPNQMNGLLNDLKFQHEEEVQEWKDRIADLEFVVEEAKERENQQQVLINSQQQISKENEQLLTQKISENKKLFEENQKLIFQIQEKQKKIQDITLINAHQQPSTIKKLRQMDRLDRRNKSIRMSRAMSSSVLISNSQNMDPNMSGNFYKEGSRGYGLGNYQDRDGGQVVQDLSMKMEKSNIVEESNSKIKQHLSSSQKINIFINKQQSPEKSNFTNKEDLVQNDLSYSINTGRQNLPPQEEEPEEEPLQKTIPISNNVNKPPKTKLKVKRKLRIENIPITYREFQKINARQSKRKKQLAEQQQESSYTQREELEKSNLCTSIKKASSLDKSSNLFSSSIKKASMEKTNLLFGSSIKKPALEMEKSNFYDSSNKKVLDVQLMDNAQEQTICPKKESFTLNNDSLLFFIQN